MNKVIVLKETTWKILLQIKIDEKKKSIDQVIQELLKLKGNNNG